MNSHGRGVLSGGLHDGQVITVLEPAPAELLMGPPQDFMRACTEMLRDQTITYEERHQMMLNATSRYGLVGRIDDPEHEHVATYWYALKS